MYVLRMKKEWNHFEMTLLRQVRLTFKFIALLLQKVVIYFNQYRLREFNRKPFSCLPRKHYLLSFFRYKIEGFGGVRGSPGGRGGHRGTVNLIGMDMQPDVIKQANSGENGLDGQDGNCVITYAAKISQDLLKYEYSACGNLESKKYTSSHTTSCLKLLNSSVPVPQAEKIVLDPISELRLINEYKQFMRESIADFPAMDSPANLFLDRLETHPSVSSRATARR